MHVVAADSHQCAVYCSCSSAGLRLKDTGMIVTILDQQMHDRCDLVDWGPCPHLSKSKSNQSWPNKHKMQILLGREMLWLQGQHFTQCQVSGTEVSLMYPSTIVSMSNWTYVLLLRPQPLCQQTNQVRVLKYELGYLFTVHHCTSCTFIPTIYQCWGAWYGG